MLSNLVIVGLLIHKHIYTYILTITCTHSVNNVCIKYKAMKTLGFCEFFSVTKSTSCSFTLSYSRQPNLLLEMGLVTTLKEINAVENLTVESAHPPRSLLTLPSGPCLCLCEAHASSPAPPIQKDILH